MFLRIARYSLAKTDFGLRKESENWELQLIKQQLKWKMFKEFFVNDMDENVLKEDIKEEELDS